MAQDTFGNYFRTASSAEKAKITSLGLLGCVAIIVAGWAIREVLRAHAGYEPETQATQQVVEPPPSEAYTFPYELKSVSMAVITESGNRTAYAQFTLILDCPTEEAQKAVAMNRAKLLDSIFEVGSQFYLEDFTGGRAPKSFEKFKAGLMDRYKKALGSAAPRQVVFKDWFIN